jgi:hypothetical protein
MDKFREISTQRIPVSHGFFRALCPPFQHHESHIIPAVPTRFRILRDKRKPNPSVGPWATSYCPLPEFLFGWSVSHTPVPSQAWIPERTHGKSPVWTIEMARLRVSLKVIITSFKVHPTCETKQTSSPSIGFFISGFFSSDHFFFTMLLEELGQIESQSRARKHSKSAVSQSAVRYALLRLMS